MTGEGNAQTDRRVIAGDGLPPTLGPYSPAVRAGGLLHVSGQPGIGDEPGVPVGPTFGEQARQAFANLERILRAGGSRPQDVVSVTVMLTDVRNFPELNEIFAEVFPTDPPARTAMEIGLAPGFHLTVACVAQVDA